MSDQKNAEPVSFGDPATEPVDLAQAFKIYNEANRTTASQAMDPGEAGGQPEEGDEVKGLGDGGEAEPGAGEGLEAAPVTEDRDGDAGVGGSSNVIEPVDFDARRQEMLQDIQRQAIESVRRSFAENQITPCTIEELYQRDEQTGRVTFKNPDDPQGNFASRAEAQQWVDAFNRQIEMRFRQEINQKQREMVMQNAPKLRLIEFAPKFNEMSKAEQEIMDDLIEPHAVRDQGGNVIGFNVDLNTMADQARRIARRFSGGKQQAEAPQAKQEEAKQSSRPAMNMPTGSSMSSEDDEPKNIGEALKMYDKMRREKGKK